MLPLLTTRAPAKINLNLVVHGRRNDGYHELSSLVMFAGVGDRLALDPGLAEGLTISGPFAAGLDSGTGNLVLRAAGNLRRLMPDLRSGHFALTKRLPVASGIGGGSADAAAALRLLARLNRLAPNHPALMAAARETGSDVPVCLGSRAVIMQGLGELLGVPLNLPRLFSVLVNPGVSVSTAEVFKALQLKPGEPLHHKSGPDGEVSVGVLPEIAVSSWHEDAMEEAQGLMATLKGGHGNDLEEPARRIAPQIDIALQAISATNACQLARMSGSGATCFGLYHSSGASADAARQVKSLKPEWWVKATVLR